MDNIRDTHTLVGILCQCPTGKVRVRTAESVLVDHFEIRDKDRAAVVVNVFNTPELRSILNAQNSLRVWFYANSSPWDQSGYRLVPNSRMAELNKRVSDTVIEVAKLEKLFIKAYEESLPHQKELLGGLYNLVEFPQPDRFAGKIRVEKSIRPLPLPGEDPRCGWSDDQLQEYLDQVKREYKENISKVMADIANRIASTIGRVSERMEAYEGKRSGSFKNSLIENCEDLADIIGDLNVSNDPTIEQIRIDIREKICSIKPDELRKSSLKRKQVKAVSDSILDRIGSFASDDDGIEVSK